MVSHRFVWTKYNGQYHAAKWPKDYEDSNQAKPEIEHKISDEEYGLSLDVLAKMYPAPKEVK